LGYGGEAAKIQERIENLYSEWEATQSEIQKGQLKHRIGSLSKKMANIYVGGTTELEMREKKDRIDDAVKATYCGITDGFVAGGGTALLRVANDLQGSWADSNGKDVLIGMDILCQSLKQPFAQILYNAGIFNVNKSHWHNVFKMPTELDKIRKSILNDAKEDYGYNCKSGKFESFFDTGIIDPVKVVISALEHASSISGLFLTTEAVITEDAN
jgi:chaperonin GroEL